MMDEDIQGQPIDHRYGLACELGVIDWLLDRNGIKWEAMQHLWWKINNPNDVLIATGPLYTMRERVNARLVTQLSAATGMPESYWLDRPLIDTPDDAADVDRPDNDLS